MRAGFNPWWAGILLLLAISAFGQEDSLQSALNALDRRERDLSDGTSIGDYVDGRGYSRYRLEDIDQDEMAFLNPNGDYSVEPEYSLGGRVPDVRNAAVERALLDFLEEDALETAGDRSGRGDDDVRKGVSSSFRERMEEDREKEYEKKANLLLSKLEDESEREEDEDKNEQYQYMRLKKYHDDRLGINEWLTKSSAQDDLEKGAYTDYSALGWSSVGLRKRPYSPEVAPIYLQSYPREELVDRLRKEENLEYEEPSTQWIDYSNVMQRRAHYPDRFNPYSVRKRFPVSKRSSNYYKSPITQHTKHLKQEMSHQYKRSPKKESASGTDPKIMKDLSNIFGMKETKPTKENTDHKKKATEQKLEKVNLKSSKKPISSTERPKQEKDQKSQEAVHVHKKSQEEILPTQEKDEEPLEVKKKSVDWSNYFGLDRRKKSSSSDNDVDNEWLMERYHKAVAMTTKRNKEYPMQNSYVDQEDQKDKKKDQRLEETKLGEMDTKLKNIEDLIVDEALKYTGAHEGATDSKEVQEVKDKVISRLATAYSLEKMRRALGEFKLSLAKQKNAIKVSAPEPNADEFYADKRVAVARKGAIEEDRTLEEDNNIKCALGKEDCEEQTYKPPKELTENHLMEIAKCPKVQKVCYEFAGELGQYGPLFDKACAVHQICLLCGDNSWFAPTRQCNFLFLAKADRACGADLECQKTARQSIRYLLNVSRSLRSESSTDCDLICADRR